MFETIVKRSKCFISCIYCSPSDVDEEIDAFCQKFESICANIALENPISSFILGDFNAKSTNWSQPGGSNVCGLLLEDI